MNGVDSGGQPRDDHAPEHASERQIAEGTRHAGKVYEFDEAHDATRPADFWFQQSDEGLILFVVFYSQACRWSRCLGCNLPSKMSRHHVPYTSLMKQIDYLFSHPEVVARHDELSKVILSNNGSILDQQTFSSTSLLYLLVQLNLNLPNLATLSIETRAEHVEPAELEFIARALSEGNTPTQLELAIGFEAFDETIRNNVFDKGLTLEVFRRLVGQMAPYGYRLKCYFMQKPVPGMSDEEAVVDIQRAIDYLSRTATEFGVAINMHLNPTFVAKGTLLADAFGKGQYVPPRLRDVVTAARHAKGRNLSLFIGLLDEGLAVDGGSFLRPGEEPLVEQLERFNRTQDFSVLEQDCRTG